MDIFAFEQKLKSLNFTELKTEAVMENEDKIVELQKFQHLKGEDASGGKIKPKYKSPYYARKKTTQNSVPGLGNPDLNLSGNLHKSAKLNIQGENYFYKSPLDYSTYIFDRYANAWGLNTSYQEKIWPYTMTSLNKLFIAQFK